MNESFSTFSQSIDLRGTPCPLNFIRCSLALENLALGECLEVYLDKGEPEEMVVSGLRTAGNVVEVVQEEINWLKIMVKISER